jgi:glycosyl transferase family 87
VIPRLNVETLGSTGESRLFSPRSLLLATRKVLAVVLLGVFPIVFAVLVVQGEGELGVLGFDFKGTIWQPGREILAGHSPYPPPLAAEMNTGNPSVYPPVALLLGVPFALMPLSIAFCVWTAMLVGAVLATLRMLGIRDWRCYTMALGSCPVVFGVVLGNIAVLLAPLAAYLWRHRDRALPSGLALGLAIALKLVLWPLLVWLIASRRKGAALVAAAAAFLSTLAAWAVIGFDGLREYPQLLSVNTDLYGPSSWSLLAGGVGLGLPLSVANAVATLLGLALLVFSFIVAKRPDGDRRAFCIALVASIALLPIVWPASLVLLLVPLALISPSVGRPWYLFAALWLAAFAPRSFSKVGTPPEGVPLAVWKMHNSPPPTAQVAVFALLVGLMTVVLLRLASRSHEPRPL